MVGSRSAAQRHASRKREERERETADHPDTKQRVLKENQTCSNMGNEDMTEVDPRSKSKSRSDLWLGIISKDIHNYI